MNNRHNNLSREALLERVQAIETALYDAVTTIKTIENLLPAHFSGVIAGIRDNLVEVINACPQCGTLFPCKDHQIAPGDYAPKSVMERLRNGQ